MSGHFSPSNSPQRPRGQGEHTERLHVVALSRDQNHTRLVGAQIQLTRHIRIDARRWDGQTPGRQGLEPEFDHVPSLVRGVLIGTSVSFAAPNSTHVTLLLGQTIR